MDPFRIMEAYEDFEKSLILYLEQTLDEEFLQFLSNELLARDTLRDRGLKS